MKQLSKAQTELVEAMRRGVRVHWMDGLNACYFRSDSMRRCTSTAFALIRLGVVRTVGDRYKHQLELMPEAVEKM